MRQSAEAKREEHLAKSKSIFSCEAAQGSSGNVKMKRVFLMSGFVIINYNQIAVFLAKPAKSVLPRLRLWSGFARLVRLIVCTCVSVAAVIKRNGT